MKKDVFDELVVVKRSGQRVSFNNYKVAVAIKSAFDSFSGKYDESIVNDVYEKVLKNIETNYVTRKTINVEDIQDIIEQELKKQNYMEVYEEFSGYRKRRAESRQAFKVKQQHKFAKAMEKINDENLLDSELGYKPNDILLEYGNTVLDEFVKSYMIDNKYLRMYDEGNIYIKDITNAPLGRVSHTNLLVDEILENATNVHELLKYLIDVKDEINGEIHISSFDVLLSKCVLRRFKILLKSNISRYLKVAGYENYVNTETINNFIDSSNDINIFDRIKDLALNKNVLDIFREASDDALIDLKSLVKENVTYLFTKLNKSGRYYSFSFGGNKNELYSFVTSMFFEIILKLDRLEKVSFIYKLSNLDDPNMNTLFDCIKDNKNILVMNAVTSNLDDVEYFANGIKIYENCNDRSYSNGRMVVSEVSINMARIGIISKNLTRKEFYSKLDEVLDLVKSALLQSFEMIGNKSKDNYKILFDNNIYYDEKLESGGKIRKVIKNSNLLIGLSGLKECVDVLEDDDLKKFKLLEDILEFVNKKCSLYRDETKLNFYTYESSLVKPRRYFMALDKSIYGIRKNITDKDCYSLVSSCKYLEDNYEYMSKIEDLFIGGNLIVKPIKGNISYKKFIFLINEMVNNKIGLVEFKRS